MKLLCVKCPAVFWEGVLWLGEEAEAAEAACCMSGWAWLHCGGKREGVWGFLAAAAPPSSSGLLWGQFSFKTKPAKMQLLVSSGR